MRLLPLTTRIVTPASSPWAPHAAGNLTLPLHKAKDGLGPRAFNAASSKGTPVMRWMLAATFAGLFVTPALAVDCPRGSYPWVDRNGVEYCKRDVIGPQEPRADGVARCPPGTRASAERGVRTCRKVRT
jgi:hypothetical protein